jgi:UTP--glucose-1-phosphate uridylyltransferase
VAVAVATAVVPVAGLATRLRPLSRGVPKGLLPVGRRSAVARVVDELAECGIARVILVTGRDRGAFAEHFEGIGGPEIVFAEQPVARGLGDAILCAAPLLEGAFVIALGDALLGRGEPARVVERLAAAVSAGAQAAIAVEEVAPERTERYGIVVPAGDTGAGSFAIRGVVEKPAPAAAPSTLAVAGRYAATPALLDALRAAPRGDEELGLAGALSALDDVVAVRLEEGEQRFDVGSVEGYCAAFVEYALADPDLSSSLRARTRALLDGHR